MTEVVDEPSKTGVAAPNSVNNEPSQSIVSSKEVTSELKKSLIK